MLTILQYSEKNTKSPVYPVLILFLFFTNLLYSQTASFTYQLNEKCAPTVVTFLNNSLVEAGTKYLWDFGKGAQVLNSKRILQEVYTNPGTYRVKLSAINGTDTVSATRDITISTGPKASFTLDKTTSCVSSGITFTSNSTEGSSPIKQIMWDFRNGVILSGTSVVCNYSSPGFYGIICKVTDQNGCSDYIESDSLIQIVEKPIANFESSDRFACEAPLAASFTNKSTGLGSMTFNWNFGNGKTSTEFHGSTIYNTSGVYDVSLQVKDNSGCTDTKTLKDYISVGSKSGEIFAQYANVIRFDPDSEICPGKLIFGSTLSPQSDYHWTIIQNSVIKHIEGNNKVSLSIIDSGKIEVKLVYGLNSSCPDSISKTFKVKWVKADFTMDKTYTCQLPTNLNLENKSENATSITWILPDTTISNSEILAYKLTKPYTYKEFYRHEIYKDEYSVLLIARNSSGCADTSVKSLQVALPVARLMPDISAGCIPLEVSFSDSSKSSEPITKWTYVINNQKIVKTNSTPTNYTFTQTGNYQSQLIIENSLGCIDTSYIVTIQTGKTTRPSLTVSPSQLCYGENLFLSGYSVDSNNIDTWEFSSPGVFTISSSDSKIIKPVRPDKPGKYDVLLAVNYNGCSSDSLFKDIYEVKAPVGNFTDTFSCDSSYRYTFISGFQGAESLVWKIDTSTYNNLDTVIYKFPSSKDYQVKLTAKNNSTGCNVSYTDIIKVRNVIANFSTEKITSCIGDSLVFDASNSVDFINNCYNEAFLWDFKDNSPKRRNYKTNQVHVYSDTGTFKVSLLVLADNGCVDSIKSEIIIASPIIGISASPDTGCSPLLVKFNATDSIGTVASWVWIYGDGEVDAGSSTNISHTYKTLSDKQFYAVLQAEDENGCKQTAFKKIKVSAPAVEFQAIDNKVCLGDTVEFLINGSVPTSYQWTFGDDSISTNTNKHCYTNTGIYDVGLKIVRNGCTITKLLSDYISVENADATYILSDSLADCYPVMINFEHTGNSSAPASGIWVFEPGIQSNVYNNKYAYTYNKPGNFETSLTIRTLNNCIDKKTKNITIQGPYATFDFSPKWICSGQSVNFNLESLDDADSYYWIFGDGKTSTLQNPQHIYDAKGFITPTLHLIKGDCEVDLYRDTLMVSYIAANFDLLPDKSTYCQDETISAVNRSILNTRSEWFLNNTQFSQMNDTSFVKLSKTGENNLTLFVYDVSGCSDTLNKTIQVSPVPSFTITGDSVICPNVPTTLKADIPAGSTIQWLPSTLFSDPYSAETNITAINSENIYAIITNSDQCQSTETFYVQLNEIPAIAQSPEDDTTIYIGESIQLNIYSNDNGLSYSWSPENNISCTSCSNPFVNPEQDIIYVVKINNKCYEIVKEFPVHVLVDFYLELPTAFTPNGDGANDIYHVEAKNIRTFEFKIYNRWGEEVFSSNNASEGWDGVVKGKLQNADSYVYHIHAVSEHGYEIDKKGTFLLIR